MKEWLPQGGGSRNRGHKPVILKPPPDMTGFQAALLHEDSVSLRDKTQDNCTYLSGRKRFIQHRKEENITNVSFALGSDLGSDLRSWSGWLGLEGGR